MNHRIGTGAKDENAAASNRIGRLESLASLPDSYSASATTGGVTTSISTITAEWSERPRSLTE